MCWGAPGPWGCGSDEQGEVADVCECCGEAGGPGPVGGQAQSVAA